MKQIISQRLTLRRIRPEDQNALFQLDNDPDVMRYINGGIATPMSVITSRSLKLMLEYDHSPFGFWAAQTTTDGLFIGWFSLRTTEVSGNTAELGYRLCRSGWDRGYATEGAQALLHQAFSSTALQRVTAQTYEKNLSSQRVLEKLGMQRIRKFRMSAEDLSEVDTSHQGTAEIWDGYDYEYALSRERWITVHAEYRPA